MCNGYRIILTAAKVARMHDVQYGKTTHVKHHGQDLCLWHGFLVDDLCMAAACLAWFCMIYAIDACVQPSLFGQRDGWHRDREDHRCGSLGPRQTNPETSQPPHLVEHFTGNWSAAFRRGPLGAPCWVWKISMQLYETMAIFVEIAMSRLSSKEPCFRGVGYCVSTASLSCGFPEKDLFEKTCLYLTTGGPSTVCLTKRVFQDAPPLASED